MNYLPAFRKDGSKDSMLMMLMGMNNLPIFERNTGTVNPMEPTPLSQTSSTICQPSSMCQPSSSSRSSWMMQNSNGIPQDAVDPKAVDSLMAKEMAILTPKQREESYLDVHGISEAVKETPQLIEASQQAMELEIRRQKDRAAYDLASFLNRAYVEDSKFRLCFLRAEMFDAKKAALRYIQFFEAKLDLFGKDLLTMDITQDDLDQDVMDVLYCGYAQFIREPDRAGRAINLWISNSEHESYSTKAMVSLIQRAGITDIVCCLLTLLLLSQPIVAPRII